MLRTVYGSKFAPDLSLGGLTGSPSPKYAGADISYKAPEVYGKVLDALLEPYAPAPNQGEIFRGIAQILRRKKRSYGFRYRNTPMTRRILPRRRSPRLPQGFVPDFLQRQEISSSPCWISNLSLI